MTRTQELTTWEAQNLETWEIEDKRSTWQTESLIVISDESGIRKEVAIAALTYEEGSITDFFLDLFTYGCESGMVSSLIHHDDTHAFFIKHYDEIEEMRVEYEQNYNEWLQPEDVDLMTFLAWFTFEEVTKEISLELDI